MPKRKLTHSFIANLTPPNKIGKRVEYYDEVVEGLLVRITHTGHRSFSFRYGTRGKRYTIGNFPEVSLAKARDLARDLKYEVKKGGDPQARKVKARNKPQEKTVEDLAELFKKRHLPKLKESTRIDYERRIDNSILPSLGKLELVSIDRVDIIQLLQKIADDNDAPIQSNRVRAILSSMFNFGIQRGIAEYNPVSGTKKLGKEKKRKRVYDEKELRLIWNAFEEHSEPFRSLFKMLLICGQRAGETRKMRWDEVEEGMWTIPAEKTKARREHKLPLPDLALQVLSEIRELNGGYEYVFTSPVKPTEPIAWLQNASKNVRKQTLIKDFRLHDLRRTAASYMAKLGTDRTILGKLLNHKGLAGDDQVTAIYDRHDYLNEKRYALEKWNNVLTEILKLDKHGQ